VLESCVWLYYKDRQPQRHSVARQTRHRYALPVMNTWTSGRCSVVKVGCCSCRVRECAGVRGVVLCRCVCVTC